MAAHLHCWLWGAVILVVVSLSNVRVTKPTEYLVVDTSTVTTYRNFFIFVETLAAAEAT